MIVVIGGGIMQMSVITEAMKLDKVTVLDLNPDCPGAKVAHDFFPISTQDYASAVQVLEGRTDLTAVVTCGTDASMTVAAIASRHHLRSHPFHIAMTLSRKDQMAAHLGNFMPWTLPLMAPCAKVVKPVDNMGGRGVSVVFDNAYAREAVELALQNSPSGEVICQEYVVGKELSAEFFVQGQGEPVLISIADRHTHLVETKGGLFAPIEFGHTLPSVLEDEVLNKCYGFCVAVIEHLGVLWGPIKFDLVYAGGMFRVIEMCARLSGGWHSTHTTPMWRDFNYVEQYLLAAMHGHQLPHIAASWRGKRKVREWVLPAGKEPNGEAYERLTIWNPSKDRFAFWRPGMPMHPACNAEKSGSLIVTAPHGESVVDAWVKEYEALYGVEEPVNG